MLTLDETLFVEHKRGLGDKGSYKLAEAIAAFANTFGGWVLLNVFDGTVAAPDLQLGGTALVDAVRDRIRGAVDPMPPFEARIIDLAGRPCWSGARI